MCPPTINFIERQVQLHRPNAILEFGSGLSTLCFAQFMRDLYGDSSRTYVYSVEQSAEVIASVRQRLARLNLDGNVQFFQAPLTIQQIAGRRTTCYALPNSCISIVKTVRPNFIIIDGPAGDDGGRFGILPLVHAVVAPTARFYLDDALRDGELEIAQQWGKLPYIGIEGMVPTQKGLLVGALERSG